MPRRCGSRVHLPFAAKCQVREGQKIVERTFVYRAHGVNEVRKKALTKLSVVRVLGISRITEDEYDVLMASKRYPDGLPPAD